MTTDNNVAPYNNSDEISVLKNQVFILLVALIVVSGTLTVVLYRQVSLANKDIAQSQGLSADVAKKEDVINTFVGRLVAYGEKHPDFVPVLKKYGLAGVPAPVQQVPKK